MHCEAIAKRSQGPAFLGWTEQEPERPEQGTPLVHTHRRPRRCRESRRWPQRAGTCHWQHSNQRAGRHTSHPGKGQAGSEARWGGRERRGIRHRQRAPARAGNKLNIFPRAGGTFFSLGQGFSQLQRPRPLCSRLDEAMQQPCSQESLQPFVEDRGGQATSRGGGDTLGQHKTKAALLRGSKGGNTLKRHLVYFSLLMCPGK